MNGHHRHQAGFTIIEALVGLAVITIIGLALGSTFLVGYTALNREARQLGAGTAAANASLTLTRDLSSSTISSGLGVTITAGSGSLSLTYGSPATNVTYTIDANNNLIRTLSGGSSGSFVAARGVIQLTVSAGTPACVVNVSLLPSAVGATSQSLTVSRRIGASGCF